MQIDQSQQVLTHCHVASMDARQSGFGKIKNACIVRQDGRVIWVGPQNQLPQEFETWPRQDLGGRWVLPAFVDCHTHLVYAGNRIAEFEQRLNGVSYAEIAQSGGGILSTVRATREASEAELIAVATPRVQQMLGFGATTLEIKSGYGLTSKDEIKMLRAARALGEAHGVRVSTSFLGAHAIPPEFNGRADEYVDLVVNEMLPEVARLGLADAVDAFCESIAFSKTQTRKVLQKACDLNLPIRLHAEQLTNGHGAQMAAEMGALSCDHLEYLDEAGVKAMAEAGTVAVLLPGAFYFLRETKLPPVELLRDYGIPIAIATDCNPGSAPTTSLPLMISMACTFFGLTPVEAIAGVTRNGAAAFGKGSELGQIRTGYLADLMVWDVVHPAELAYGFGQAPDCERL
jgi:imidazolonepropionase